MSTPLARRRQNSSAASTRSRGLSLHNRAASRAVLPGTSTPPAKIEPKSAHTSDPFLQAFLSPTFDAAEYLNGALPPLQGSSASLRSTTVTNTKVSLAELSTEAQTVVTQLNAHTTRLTGTLSQLTEDILRSGSRLAYEVELLRGETLGLSEALLGEGPLKADLERFVGPAGIEKQAAVRRASLVSTPLLPGAEAVDSPAPITPAAVAAGGTAGGIVEAQDGDNNNDDDDDEPPYISHLRTLTLVRSRLDAVIKTFGEAMEFIFPPSEISVSSGFLSVSAPDFPDRHSGTAEQISMEDRGQQTLKKLREEISGLLKRGGKYEEKVQGVEQATKRVEEIKLLTSVWKGTAEEKGRMRFVEQLARLVEERHRELVKEAEGQRDREQARRGQDENGASRREQTSSSEAAAAESRGPLGGYGFMNQWQKIRGGL